MYGKGKMVAAELYSDHQPNSPQETFEATNLQSNSLGLDKGVDKQQRKFYKIRQTQWFVWLR